jgi:hypothetical protein
MTGWRHRELGSAEERGDEKNETLHAAGFRRNGGAFR